MSADEFRAAGHGLVDRIADFLGALRSHRVAPGLMPPEIRARLGSGRVPENGAPAVPLLEEAAELLIANSVLSGHPRFLAYIMSSAAPIGALADLLASAVNPNLGAWHISPMATEIEAQAIRWIGEILGYPDGAGGVLSSGGNMANFIGFIAGRRAKAPWDVRTGGAGPRDGKRLCVYASEETHTWIQKAADLSGLGTDAIRWVKTDDRQRMDMADLRRRVRNDREEGQVPLLVVGTAGTVSTGAVDPLPALGAFCREEGLWFHVDGAYGGFAVGIPGAPEDLAGLTLADSVAVDPHKWLYTPIEAGCTLVRERASLHAAFEYHPPYYRFDEGEDQGINFHEYGPQNSRGLRGLKVWLGLRMAGRSGYRTMIGDDMALARELYDAVSRHPELEAAGVDLSITTFRFVPADLAAGGGSHEDYLNRLNEELLRRLQEGGEAFLSNAVVRGRYLLRSCIVNFRTSSADVAAIPEIVARIGRVVDRELRPAKAEITSDRSGAGEAPR